MFLQSHFDVNSKLHLIFASESGLPQVCTVTPFLLRALLPVSAGGGRQEIRGSPTLVAGKKSVQTTYSPI